MRHRFFNLLFYFYPELFTTSGSNYERYKCICSYLLQINVKIAKFGSCNSDIAPLIVMFIHQYFTLLEIT